MDPKKGTRDVKNSQNLSHTSEKTERAFGINTWNGGSLDCMTSQPKKRSGGIIVIHLHAPTFVPKPGLMCPGVFCSTPRCPNQTYHDLDPQDQIPSCRKPHVPKILVLETSKPGSGLHPLLHSNDVQRRESGGSCS